MKVLESIFNEDKHLIDRVSIVKVEQKDRVFFTEKDAPLFLQMRKRVIYSGCYATKQNDIQI
jgi:hypothetical protein